MQVLYKIDRVFIFVYSSIILLTGLFIFISSGKAITVLLAITAEALYLYFALKKPLRRRKALKTPFPNDWRDILQQCSHFYRSIDEEGRKRFEQDIQIFFSDFPIEGIRRRELDIKTKLLVASGFAAMLHGRPFWEPPIKDGVLVYPGRTFNKDYKIGRGRFAGMARGNSPLIISEESLKESFRNPSDGYNVVFHELAHYFDFEDGRAEGIPSTRLFPGKLIPWKNVIAREWQKVLQGRSVLRPYAGTNEAELFAVAVEFFFEKPALMKKRSPEFYELLKEFFNLDTAEIMKEAP